MTKLIENNSMLDLNEIYQPVGMWYAFLQKEGTDYRMIHKFCKCRDFASDQLHAARIGKDFPENYGIAAKGKSDPINLRRVHLALKGSFREGGIPCDFDNLKKGLSILNEFEARIGSSPSRLTRFEGAKDYYHLSGPPRWLANNVSLSLYTLLIRLLLGWGGEIEEGDNLEIFLTRISSKEDTEWLDLIYLRDYVLPCFRLELLMRNVTILQSKIEWTNPVGNYDETHNFSGIITAGKVITKGTDYEYHDGVYNMNGKFIKAYKELEAKQ